MMKMMGKATRTHLASILCFWSLPLLLVSIFEKALCYSIPNNSNDVVSRRHLFQRGKETAVVLVLAGSNSLGSLALLPHPAEASPYCTQGVGDGCDDLAQGNDFIKSLQEKSAANKERYSREAREAYYMKNYPDYFGSISKALVKKPDGTFMVVTESELEQLRRENKLTTKMPLTMGGQVTDLTQRPILMLREDKK